MMRTALLGALAAAAIGFAAPANATMANPGLAASGSSNVEQAQYYYGGGPYYGRRHHWRRDYAWGPRRCWTERIRTYHGTRFIRRCR